MQVKSKTDGLSSVINAHLQCVTKQSERKDWKCKPKLCTYTVVILHWTNKRKVHDLQHSLDGLQCTMVFPNNYYVLKYNTYWSFFHGFSKKLDAPLLFFLSLMVILSNLYSFLILWLLVNLLMCKYWEQVQMYLLLLLLNRTSYSCTVYYANWLQPLIYWKIRHMYI